jgi:hypothetical protein
MVLRQRILRPKILPVQANLTVSTFSIMNARVQKLHQLANLAIIDFPQKHRTFVRKGSPRMVEPLIRFW